MSPDSVTVKKAPGGNLLRNPLIGLVLLAAAFGLLIWNENKVDISQIAVKSVEIAADGTADKDMQGKLVSVSGPLVSTEQLSDGQYLKPGAYVALERTVEMYAWMESSSSTNSETQETYNYNKNWTTRPIGSGMFKSPVGHENPVMAVQNYTRKATSAKVGAYSIDMSSVKLPETTPLSLNNDNVMYFPGSRIDGDVLFVGRGSPSSPEIGDLRIKYSVVEPNVFVTVFGALQGTMLATYTDANNNSLYNMVKGNRAQALSNMQKSEVMMTWVARVIGLLLMWGGLIILSGKVAGLAAMNPMTMRIVMLLVALVLTGAGVFIGTSMK
ncbi:MAG: TMEM43 family protein [Patescibacteria group bacterium]